MATIVDSMLGLGERDVGDATSMAAVAAPDAAHAWDTPVYTAEIWLEEAIPSRCKLHHSLRSLFEHRAVAAEWNRSPRA